jgi:hypothetical protein
MSALPLESALPAARLFRAGQQRPARVEALPTGLVELDAALPWGGLPRGALTEILLPQHGLGELRLLLPALARLSRSERLLLVAPPFTPYAPALAAGGICLRHLAWVHCAAAQALWAAEQSLRAGCLGAVLAWSEGGDDRALRRLQLAADSGRAYGLLIRPLRQAANASPAALRLLVEAPQGRPILRVLKCRGAVAPAAGFALPRPQ